MSRAPWPLLLLALASCSAEYSGSSAAAPPLPTDATAAQTAVEPGQSDRQITYKASLTLLVKDFGATEARVSELIRESGGYLAQFREDRPSGSQRGGTWAIRVPVKKFDSFLDAAGKLGVSQQRSVQADDVTEEYVDLTARLKNKQQLEARLLELVAQRTDEIKDLLALEAELSRVREEIERMQGRLRWLNDRIALTTIELAAYESREYLPPEAPTFASKLASTWGGSLTALRQLGEGLILAAVALVPWLSALLVLLTPLIWFVRRRWRRRPPIVPAQAI